MGLEFARQYKTENWKVIACCRNPETATELAKADVSIRKLELLDFGEFNNFAQSLDGVPIDLLINNAAIIDRSKGEGLSEIETDRWVEGFKVNSIAPVFLSKALLENLACVDKPVAATIGSEQGCLTLYDTGGIYIYRTSKAAAHSPAVILANDLKELGIPYVCLRPGHTKTDMGGSQAIYEIEDSVSLMRDVLTQVDVSQTGCFLDRSGAVIPWSMGKSLNE